MNLAKRDAAIYVRRTQCKESLHVIATDYNLTAEGVRQICLRVKRRLLNVDGLSTRALNFMERAMEEGYKRYTEIPRHMVVNTKNIGLHTFNELERVYKGAEPITLKQLYDLIKKRVL